MIKVLIIDASSSAADTAIALRGEGFDVVTHSGPLGASAAMQTYEPQVVLVDSSMQGASAEKLVALLKQNTNARVLLYAESSESELAAVVERTGADGYVPKSARPLRLAAAIKAVLSPKIG